MVHGLAIVVARCLVGRPLTMIGDNKLQVQGFKCRAKFKENRVVVVEQEE